MTFSIVARTVGANGQVELGIAVASKFLAVGSAVPAAAVGAGALATQAFANLAYRIDGLELLRDGLSASHVVDQLTSADDMASQRQLGVVDRDGGSASFTGGDCFAWAGHRTGAGYAIQGNILTGEDVVADMEKVWLASSDLPIARRLLAALAAGDAAGGDSRGRQSAALYVVTPNGGYGGTSDVMVDLRVDDHPHPISELARLMDLHALYFERPNPDECLPLEGSLAQEVRSLLSDLGYTNDDLNKALEDMSGVENLEERMVKDRIDPVVLDHLRKIAR